MPRKGENIYKRKDGRWEGRFIKSRDLNGKARYGYVYGKSYMSVKQALKEKQIGSSSLDSITEDNKTLYSSVLSSWLEAQRVNVKESTYARYYHIVNAHLIPEVGMVQTERITAQMVEQYVNRLVEAGRLDGKGGLSTKTAGDILSVLKASIEYAKDNNCLIQCNLQRVVVKQTNEEIRVLSSEEQKKLTLFLLEDIDSIKFGILLSLYTGLRIGEVCALKWGNVNLSDGILSVRQTMQRITNMSKLSSARTKIIVTEPKSKCSKRDIPLPQFITEIARKLQQGSANYILTGEKNRFVEPRTMQNRFKAIIKECRICSANYHALRHTFATRCVEVGFDIKTLSEILGHSNVNITLNRYVHSSFALKKENMAKVNCITN